MVSYWSMALAELHSRETRNCISWKLVEAPSGANSNMH